MRDTERLALTLHFCKEEYINNMTIQNRAKLMVEAFEILDSDWYSEPTKQESIDRAIEDLEYFDKQVHLQAGV